MSTAATHTTNTTTQAGFPPAPSEAHQRAGVEWVQIPEKELDNHCLSGEFFISREALASIEAKGLTVGALLPWFNQSRGPVRVGDRVAMSDGLQAYFGFDEDKPNRLCFFVQITLASPVAQATEPVYVAAYTRAQAIEDGTLIDVASHLKNPGFTAPVAMTHAAWCEFVEWTPEDSARQVHQDEIGRLTDVLMLASAATRRAGAGPVSFFEVGRVPRDGRSKTASAAPLKLVMHDGDNGEPVMTIMEPDES